MVLVSLSFDGRGGPPARGGGNTPMNSMPRWVRRIQADDIQLTIQGQTISSNFGTNDSCQYNLEQLLSSGIQNQVYSIRREMCSD